MVVFTDIRTIVRVIKKRLWYIILIPLVFFIATFLLSRNYFDKVYEADAALYVIGTDVEPGATLAYSDLLLGEVLVKDYRELIRRRTVANQVIDEMGLKNVLTPSALSKTLTVNLKVDTRILEIKVVNKDPVLAADLANKVAEVFAEKAVQIMKIKNVEIVDRAEVPSSPVKPNPLTDAQIAFVAGLIIVLMTSFVLEYFDDTVKSHKDIDKTIKLPVIGKISNYKSLSKWERGEILNNPVVNFTSCTSKLAEAYRMLRTNIQFAEQQNQIKTLLVTSTNKQEGKTTVASNLAVAFANSGKRTLLVDCDMRDSRICSIFEKYMESVSKHKKDKGMTHIILNEGDVFDSIIITSIEGLYIVPSGTVSVNPGDLVGLEVMKQFIIKVRETFDVVILDSSPVCDFADASVLSTYCDGVILVATVHKTRFTELIKAKDLLAKVNARVLGVVLNKVSGYDG